MFLPITAGSTSSTKDFNIAFSRLTFDTPQVELTESIADKITRYAKDNGIPRWELDSLIKHETGGAYDCTRQSEVRYNFSSAKRGITIGDRERSYGCAQIHLPDWPKITREQAIDPDFALQFIVDHWSERSSMWYYWYKKYH